jgi:demethylmenaquinone methyltransferase/2-methoxy-6-polyprenyl-1,4-benzoquinol methylase
VTDEKAPALPHGEPRVVAAMFDRIAPSYDLLNHLLSFGLDTRWRRFAAKQANLQPGDRALDIAAGTGDLAFDLARKTGPGGMVVASDLVMRMLVLGREKAVKRSNETYVDFHTGDAVRLPYRDDAFRAATMAFGGRNVPDLLEAFREMTRVVGPGGRVVFLELNRPSMPGFRHVYDWYFHTFSPLVGGLISGDRAAYSYLPRSVDHFESVEEIKAMMAKAGLVDVKVHRMTFGAAFVHVGTVPPAP